MEKIRNYVNKRSNAFAKLTEKAGEIFDQKRSRYLWIAGLLYKIILDIYFVMAVSVIWSGMGLMAEPNFIRYCISWGAYIFGYYLILSVHDLVIEFFLHIQWVLMIAPVIVLYGLQKDRSGVYLFFVLLVLFLQVLVGRKKDTLPAISFCHGKVKNYFVVFSCIVIAAVWGIMAIYNDFAGLKAFSWSYIYTMRANLEYPFLFGYIIPWTTKALIPWLLMIGLFGKRYFLAAYSCVAQVLFYMLLGYKAPLLMMAVIVAVYLLYSFHMILPGLYGGLIAGSLLGTVGSMLERISEEKTHVMFNAVLGMRTLFLPAGIKFDFYEFFSKYPKSFFSDGTLGRLFSQTNLYKNSLGVTIYAYGYDGSTVSNSNTGYLGDSYAQMGVLGMLLIGLLVILVIQFISKYQSEFSLGILYSLVACICVALNDNAFLTAFLTGGIWVFLMIITIFADGGKSDDKL